MTYWWPLMENCVSKAEREAMAEFVINSDRLTYGEQIKRFERDWCNWNGSHHSLFVNSGTSADYLIIAACKHLYNWGEGDEILIPAVTSGTAVSWVLNLGLHPVLADIDPRTLSPDPDDLSRKITPRTRAIFLTHCLGIPNDLDTLRRIASQHGLPLLEDCCEAHGGEMGEAKVGNFGVASSFSFFWGHHMTTIEGGMVCTGDEEWAEVARSLRNHGMTRDMARRAEVEAEYPELDSRFCFYTAGFNLRGTEMHALLGQMQLGELDASIARRNRNYRRFMELSEKYGELFDTFHAPQGGTASSFALGFLFGSRGERDAVLQLLEESGIETRPVISGNLAHQPFVQRYLQATGRDFGALAGAEQVHQCGMYIGNSQFVGDRHLDRLDDILAGHIAGRSGR